MAEKPEVDLKYKEVPGRITLIKLTYYRGCPVYIRQIDQEIFEYLFIIENEMYSNYIIAKMEEGQDKLTQEQILDVAGLIFASACTSIDAVIEIKKEEVIRLQSLKKKKKLSKALSN